jgi:membrane associated rhomboid family serine protease
MIIPIGLNHVIRGLPRVTIAIIAACVLMHVYASEIAPSPESVRDEILSQVKRDLAAQHTDADHPPDPYRGRDPDQVEREVRELIDRIPMVRFGYRPGSGLSWRLLTCAFVHAGWLHLIGNMLFLWLAGAALEDRWGRARFAGFYAAGAVASALFFSVLHTGPPILLVGASGAISALMGAFLVCFARMQIQFAYWIGIRAGRFDAVAYVALPLWFVTQLLEAWGQSYGPEVSSVAFTAHIGGFLFGVATAFVGQQVAKRKEAASPQLPVARVARAPAAPPPAQVSAPPPPVEVSAPPKVEAPKPEPQSNPESGPRFLA